jgi:hypothetical protein
VRIRNKVARGVSVVGDDGSWKMETRARILALVQATPSKRVSVKRILQLLLGLFIGAVLFAVIAAFWYRPEDRVKAQLVEEGILAKDSTAKLISKSAEFIFEDFASFPPAEQRASGSFEEVTVKNEAVDILNAAGLKAEPGSTVEKRVSGDRFFDIYLIREPSGRRLIIVSYM